MMGLCKDICLPHEVRFSIDLPDSDTRPDPVIATALASVPFSEAEAGVKLATCQIRPTKDGLRVEASVTLPKTGGKEETVIEVTNPQIWVSEPTTTRKGAVLTSLAELEHMDGKPFALDRSGIRITVIGKSYAVDVQGCD
jgi:DsbC/DsbD-like thiol-disulfide interchange protein